MCWNNEIEAECAAGRQENTGKKTHTYIDIHKKDEKEIWKWNVYETENDEKLVILKRKEKWILWQKVRTLEKYQDKIRELRIGKRRILRILKFYRSLSPEKIGLWFNTCLATLNAFCMALRITSIRIFGQSATAFARVPPIHRSSPSYQNVSMRYGR